MTTNEKDSGHGGGANFVQVAVHTTSGSYPADGHERVNANQNLEVVLKKAAKELNIADTTGWIALSGDQRVSSDASFAEQGLSGTVEIDWGPEEGGGGA